MDSPRPRKRRAINACVSCRTSKVRCDGNRPCQRCDRNGATCQYFDAVKDENVLRIERLENEMAALREHMRIQRHQDKSVRRPEDYTWIKEANPNTWRQCRLQGVLFPPYLRWCPTRTSGKLADHDYECSYPWRMRLGQCQKSHFGLCPSATQRPLTQVSSHGNKLSTGIKGRQTHCTSRV